MLNKKNIAIAMTAATAVSAFAPMATAFAAVVDSTNTTEIQAIKDKAYSLYQKKFTTNPNLLLKDDNTDGIKDNLGKWAYTISVQRVNVDGSTISGVSATTPTNYAQFVTDLDACVEDLASNQKVLVTYTFNGRELADGQIVDYKTDDVTYSSSEFDLGNGFTEDSAPAEPTSGGVQYKTSTLQDGTPVAMIRISNDTTTDEARYLTVKAGDAQLDAAKPIFRQVNGYYVNASGIPVQKVDNTVVAPTLSDGLGLGLVVEGFMEAKSDDADATIERDAIVKDADVIQNVDAVVSDLMEVLNGNQVRYTVKGNELAKEIYNRLHEKEVNGIDEDANFGLKDVDVYVVKKDGTELKNEEITANGQLTNTNVKNVRLEFKDRAKLTADFETIGTLTITGERSADISLVINRLAAIQDNDPNVLPEDVDVTAGLDRYKTAVEVSKLGWADEELESGAAVLVSGDEKSLVDGLAATPLAASLNGDSGAPVLLTKKDEVPTEVINELKRLGVNKVYIVGGTSVVSDAVANTLTSKYGISVERLAGDTRYDTSLAVAKKMATNAGGKVEEVFVAGGYGAADALSVSGKAGELEAPIVLTPAEGITNDLKLFLNTKVDLDADVVDIHVIGGTSVVSEDAYKQMLDIDGDIKRVSGINRQETNAAVIKAYYTNLTDAIIAKSDNKGMVDALGAGALAAKQGSALVLATDDLIDNQEDNLKAACTIGATKLNVVQVGYGVAKSVAQYVATVVKTIS